jgi:hypothetical protein
MNDLVNGSGKGLTVADFADLPEFNPDAMGELFTEGLESGIDKLSSRGSKWRIIRGSVETIVADEDNNPLSVFKVVILTSAPGVQRTYYKGKYDPDSSEAPSCHSTDGHRPDANVPDPQSKLCINCPQMQWGSATSEVTGKGIPACRAGKDLAVVDALDPEAGPMRFHIPVTAHDDWKAYTASLQRAGKTPAMVVTTLGFDTDASYPKPTFKPAAVLTAEQVPPFAVHLLSGACATVLGLAPPVPVQSALPVDTDALDEPPVARVSTKTTKKKSSKKKVVSKKSDEAPTILDAEGAAAVEQAAAKESVLQGASDDDMSVLGELGAFAGLSTSE